MTKHEFIMLHRSQIECLERAGITTKDLKNADIYEDLMRLRKDGLKMEYCVNYAVERYGVSEARVWRIIRRMRSLVDSISE